MKTMKKAILVIACVIAAGVVSATSMTVMAHGHRGGYRMTGSASYGGYGTCGVAGCNIAGAHQHGAYHNGGYYHSGGYHH